MKWDFLIRIFHHHTSYQIVSQSKYFRPEVKYVADFWLFFLEYLLQVFCAIELFSFIWITFNGLWKWAYNHFEF